MIRPVRKVAQEHSEEPGAGKLHAGICAGGARQRASLPRGSEIRAERKERMRTAVVAAVAGFAVALNVAAQEKPKMNETSPAQVVEIQKQIELLKVHKGASPFLNIEEVGGEAIIQLSRGKPDWGMNIAYYPSKERPEKALAAVGMTIPKTWKESQFEAGTVVLYTVPEADLPKLPQFIHDLFVKFFKRPPTYKIACSIEDM